VYVHPHPWHGFSSVLDRKKHHPRHSSCAVGD
jgi:hypothetical protein